MILKIKGKLTYSWDSIGEKPLIGGLDIIFLLNMMDAHAKENGTFGKKYTLAFADARFTGELDVSEGSQGYSEMTPGSPRELLVNRHNILDHLSDYINEEITMWLADEPINTLED